MLNEWRKIGERASQKAQKNKINFSNYKNLNSLKKLIEKAKVEYFKDTKPIATRKSSEIFLKNVAKFPNLIGGSADLAGQIILKLKIIK